MVVGEDIYAQLRLGLKCGESGEGNVYPGMIVPEPKVRFNSSGSVLKAWSFA